MNPLLDFTSLPRFADILPAHVNPAIEQLIAEAQTAIMAAAKAESVSWATVVEPLQDATGRAWGAVTHLNAVISSPALRDAHNAALPKVTQFYTEVGLNRSLFERYKTLAENPVSLTDEQRALVDHEVRDFRLSGVELEGAARERYAALAQSRVDHIYADFIGRAAQARKSTPAQIDTVAQGRVWTGAQALERGLVDRVGHYTDALASAARRAQLAPDHRIVYLERSVGRLERLLDWFGGASLTAWVATLERPWTSGLPPVLATVHTDLDWLAAQARSGQPYPPALIHCLCGSTGL